MIDSVLKGTGNSRLLKSAVPAGTSWADALAMLQAGTFPIDFNGINTEGFQQVGTPLNKANLLKDATALTLGLTGDVVPNDMFDILAHAGDLHVWRKTVTNKQASYNLSDVKTDGTLANGNTGYARVTLSYGSSVSVSSDGYVTIKNQTDQQFYAAQSSNWPSLSGKFIKITDYSGDSSGSPSYANSDFQIGTILYIPSGGNIAHNGSGRIYLTKYQIVTGHGAGTTTTYPVSTNRNAYQEGKYGKAGYTLGDVKTGTFQIGQGATTIAANRAIIKYGASVSVTDTGTASIANESELTVTSDSSQSAVDKLKGKFFRFSQLPFSSSAFSVGEFYFFPANTVFTKQSSGNWYASKYQTVTSHGKTEPEYTIEYLGCLGDKAMVQVVSYVGTGTYGEDNPCSLTFDFAPKLVIISTAKNMTFAFFNTGILSGNFENKTVFSVLSASITNRSYVSAKKDGKTISWYSTSTPDSHFNVSGAKYTAIAIG